MIATVLGTTYLGNTYQASSSVSNVLFELLAAGALSAVLVPTFVEHLDVGDDAEAERLASGMLGLALVGLGVVTRDRRWSPAPEIADVLTTRAPDPKIAEQQESLSTFFLYFFIPQVIFYAWGTVSTAVLYAKRQLHRRRDGADRQHDRGRHRAWRSSGCLHGEQRRPRPHAHREARARARRARSACSASSACPRSRSTAPGSGCARGCMPRDERLRRLLHLSGWAVLQHAGIGILLGAAIVMGNRRRGRRRRVPVRVRAVPRAVRDPRPPGADHDPARAHARREPRRPRRVRRELRWRARPACRCSSSPCRRRSSRWRCRRCARSPSTTSADNVDLLAAAIASLGDRPAARTASFLLFARALYALGDSRTPALDALVTACLGAAFMIVGVELSPTAPRGCSRSGSGTAWRTCSVRSRSAFVLPRRLAPTALPAALPLALDHVGRSSVPRPGGSSALIGPTGRVVTIVAARRGRRVGGCALRRGAAARPRSGRADACATSASQDGSDESRRPRADGRAARSARGSARPRSSRTASLIAAARGRAVHPEVERAHASLHARVAAQDPLEPVVDAERDPLEPPALVRHRPVLRPRARRPGSAITSRPSQVAVALSTPPGSRGELFEREHEQTIGAEVLEPGRAGSRRSDCPPTAK